MKVVGNERTLTTLELALPCSYIRRAPFTRGIWDTLLTKSCSEESPFCDCEAEVSLGDNNGVDNDGVGSEDVEASDKAGVGPSAEDCFIKVEIGSKRAKNHIVRWEIRERLAD